MDAQQKQQIADKLLSSNNILVTVSTNPSVDQLAACIGLTLALNKMGKHAAAVFSGRVPSTIEFLQPEKTIEKTTDSLRDFIISLDKSKADKLRYKVEDKVVKIFITPYKTSISDKDLEFSQGDFNVDIVVALGVHNPADIDQAITAHGRILHDATLSTINITAASAVGTLNWVDGGASSLSEMVVHLLKTMNQKVLDGQMATSFLTGIVAETQRFSNAKTRPQTMTISAELMAAGANQQLVATKLEPPKPKPAEPPKAPPVQAAQPAPPIAKASPSPEAALAQATPTEGAKPADDGTIAIQHINLDEGAESEEEKQPDTPQIDIDREGTLRRLEGLMPPADTPASALPAAASSNPNLTEDSKGRKILQPLGHTEPAMTGALSAPPAAPSTDDGLALPHPSYEDIEQPSGAPPVPPAGADGFGQPPSFSAGPPSFAPPATDNPLGAPFSAPPTPTDTAPFAPPSADPAAGLPLSTHADTARDAVRQAMGSQSGPLPPIQALNALPVHLDTPGAPPMPTDQPPTSGMPLPPPVPPPMVPPAQ